MCADRCESLSSVANAAAALEEHVIHDFNDHEGYC